MYYTHNDMPTPFNTVGKPWLYHALDITNRAWLKCNPLETHSFTSHFDATHILLSSKCNFQILPGQHLCFPCPLPFSHTHSLSLSLSSGTYTTFPHYFVAATHPQRHPTYTRNPTADVSYSPRPSAPCHRIASARRLPPTPPCPPFPPQICTLADEAGQDVGWESDRGPTGSSSPDRPAHQRAGAGPLGARWPSPTYLLHVCRPPWCPVRARAKACISTSMRSEAYVDDWWCQGTCMRAVDRARLCLFLPAS